MERVQKELLRMEIQVSELIRMVAHLNERLRQLEQRPDRSFYLKIERLPSQVHHRTVR